MTGPFTVSDRLEQEWKAELDSNYIIQLADPIQPKIPCGEYDAICVSVRRAILPNWNRAVLLFQFQLRQVGPAHGVLLPGYVNLGSTREDKRQSRNHVLLKRPSGRSKLARWWRIILHFDANLSRKDVDVRVFRRFLYRVLVTNVENDNRQRPVAFAGQYQVISEIVAVVQQLGNNS
jgi:hypothetical protein